MNDDSDIVSHSDANIDDLISRSAAAGQKVQVSSDEVEEKLKSKIREIDEKRKEVATQREAESLGVGYISLKGFPISPEALALVGEEQARRIGTVCFFLNDTEFRLGSTQPEQPEVGQLIATIQAGSRARGQVYKISQLSLQHALTLYRTIPHVRKTIGGIEITEAELKKFQGKIGSFRDIASHMQHVSTTESLTVIMAGAIQAESSDVHIEAGQDEIKVRYRIDGMLYDVATLPKRDWPKMINRLKLVAHLKINVVDVPQDGRFTIYLANEFIDVRVSTVPSTYGESVVMRLLMSSATGLQLEDIGLVGTAYDILKKEIERPNGMILTTGPTGSGKTTTLYAILKKLNSSESKIITLENPIEYRIKGITQSQVESGEQVEASSRTKHFTYATGLRAVLRQDPDIVMVGEIRDHETAEIAIQAALTGHLMLSTLHTNSAAGAIPRLLSMNVLPFLLAPSLNVVIGQRLVRKVCQYCKEPYTPPADMVARVREVLDSIPADKRGTVTPEAVTFTRGKGCDRCSSIGFKGRIGIFEILTMNKEIEKLILTGQVSEYQIRDIAASHGMLTMIQDGMLKVAQGMTAPEEVFNVTE